MSTDIPRNLISQSGQTPHRDDAAIEAEWIANNVPAERLELHWRYENGTIQLYERRLRSLPSYGVGPALRSYLRTRLEWFSDNKLYAKPRGTILVIVETNGDVDVQLAEPVEQPLLSVQDLVWEDDALKGASLPGTLIVRKGEELVLVNPEPMRDALETFAQDLLVTLSGAFGYSIVERAIEPQDVDGAEIALVNEELGLVVLDGCAGPLTAKLEACFDKLWSQSKTR